MLSILFCLEATSLVSVTQAKTHSPSINTPYNMPPFPWQDMMNGEWRAIFILPQFKTNRATGGFWNYLTALSQSDRIPSEALCSSPFYLWCKVGLWAKRVCNPYNFLLLSLNYNSCAYRTRASAKRWFVAFLTKYNSEHDYMHYIVKNKEIGSHTLDKTNVNASLWSKVFF